MTKPRRIPGSLRAVALIALSTGLLAGCTAGQPTSPSQQPTETPTSAAPPPPVEITIGNQPAATETARLELFNTLIAKFKAAHPNYVVTTVEDGWDAQTFAARLAAGDLPTVMGIPFTEIRGLIARGQVADLTDAVTELGVTAELNPALVNLVSQDGHVYGIPTMAYAMGLIYNRDIFQAAGLDPDAPPTTWDEVRAAAKQIADKTDAYGFAQVTTENQGGWVLSAQIASRGGSLVDETGGTITFNDQPAIASLQLLHDMRWQDESLSPNGLMAALDLAQAFAGGQVGMFVLQSEAYRPLTELLAFPGENFGFGTIPVAKAGDNPVTLSGGNIDIVRPDATAEQAKAAVEWIQLAQLGKYLSEEAARADAEALASQGSAVAIPGMPAVTAETYERYLGWIADLNNVPVANFQPFLDTVPQQVVWSEPPVKAQDIYASLDPVVQAVITNEKADIPALLAEAAGAAQKTLDR